MACGVANSYSLLTVCGYCECIIEPSMLMKMQFQFFPRETSDAFFRSPQATCRRRGGASTGVAWLQSPFGVLPK